LAAIETFGFVLAGGYAVQAHGLLKRISEDVDLLPTAPIPPSSVAPSIPLFKHGRPMGLTSSSISTGTPLRD
jgi:hypothetical protein